MFNLGFQEILFIGVLALIIIGPKELPTVARVVGRALNDLKRATEGIKDEFTQAKFLDRDDLSSRKMMPHQTEAKSDTTEPELLNNSDKKDDENRNS